MDKNILNQYSSLRKEANEVKEKIKDLERQIKDCEKKLEKLNKEIVQDKVSGGYGGTQHFTIEGIPSAEIVRTRESLRNKQMRLNLRKATLCTIEEDLDSMIIEVEKFIHTIDDSYLRRIINHRVVEDKTWDEVARSIGGNTADSVRMMFNRFMDK